MVFLAISGLRSCRSLSKSLHRSARFLADQTGSLGQRVETRADQLLHIVRPKFFLPIYAGTLNRKRYVEMAVEEGWARENTIMAKNGESILFAADKWTPGPEVPHGSLLVDQTGAVVSNIVVKDRLMLAEEGLVAVIQPTILSLKAAISTYELQGGTANIFVNDDGMQLIPEEQARARREFYEEHSVGWVARPGHKPKPEDGEKAFIRKGKFKKASNMNYALMDSNKVEDKLANIHRHSGWNNESEAQAYEICLNQVLEEEEGRAWADGNIRIGDYILLHRFKQDEKFHRLAENGWRAGIQVSPVANALRDHAHDLQNF